MHAPVIVAGEALIDIVISSQGESEHVGGSPANVAVGLARLGHDTSLATYVGTDERGVRIVEAMAAENVGLAEGSTAAERTPTATALLGDDGAATYAFKLEWRLDPELDLGGSAHFHTGSIAAILEPGADAVLALARRAREQGTVSYDPNARPQLMGSPAPTRERVEELIALSDVVKSSDEDIEWLYEGGGLEETLEHWIDLGASLAVVTRGGEGALVRIAGHTRSVALEPVKVADTVGAGDSFMAGLISGLLDAGLLGAADSRERLAQAGHDDVAAAVDRALRCAAITVSRSGANPPRRDEL